MTCPDCGVETSLPGLCAACAQRLTSALPAVVDEAVSEPAGWSAGEKLAAVLAALERPGDDAPAPLLVVGQLVGQARRLGAGRMAARHLPPLSDSDAWDGALGLLAGVVLELRSDGAAWDEQAARAAGLDVLGGIIDAGA